MSRWGGAVECAGPKQRNCKAPLPELGRDVENMKIAYLRSEESVDRANAIRNERHKVRLWNNRREAEEEGKVRASPHEN